MSSCRIVIESPPTAAERAFIEQQLAAYLAARVGDPRLTRFEPVGCLLRDADQRLQGGLVGRLGWRWLYIESLWIEPPLRRQGYGRRLLHAAEAQATAADGVGVLVDSFDPQAVAFYQHHGYQVVYSLPDFPPGQRLYSLTKRLSAPASTVTGEVF